MGEERDHARFSLRSGGARARGVAFRTSQRSLAATGAKAHDVAVSLERNRWNGAVEARVVLRSLSETRPGTLTDLGPGGLLGRGGRRARRRSGRVVPRAPGAQARAPRRPRPPRPRPRRGGGRPSHQRRPGAARRCRRPTAGAPGWRRCWPAWTRMARRCADGPRSRPPGTRGISSRSTRRPCQRASTCCGRFPDEGLVHLAWGEPEREFAMAHWRSQLDLRPPLIELWRAITAAGALEGAELERMLTGRGCVPAVGCALRPPAQGARRAGPRRGRRALPPGHRGGTDRPRPLDGAPRLRVAARRGGAVPGRQRRKAGRASVLSASQPRLHLPHAEGASAEGRQEASSSQAAA